MIFFSSFLDVQKYLRITTDEDKMIKHASNHVNCGFEKFRETHIECSTLNSFSSDLSLHAAAESEIQVANRWSQAGCVTQPHQQVGLVSTLYGAWCGHWLGLCQTAAHGSIPLSQSTCSHLSLGLVRGSFSHLKSLSYHFGLELPGS